MFRILKIQFFTFRGAARAVDGVSFQVAKNQTLGLIGESGCGKTTMAMAIMQFVKPPGRIVGGKILFNGSDIVSMNDEQIRQLRGKEICHCPAGGPECLESGHDHRQADHGTDSGA